MGHLSVKPLRPTPFLKALETELVYLLKREGPLDIRIAKRQMGITGNLGAFKTVLERAVKKGLVERDGVILSSLEAEA